MKQQQILLVSGGFLLLMVIYFFGNTTPPPNNNPKPVAQAANTTPSVTTTEIITKAKKSLNQQQLNHLLQLENGVVRGDVKAQQIAVFKQLANFWGDTLQQPSIGAFYFGESAKLENSEKNLTFAAHLLLDNLMADNDAAMQNWEATQAKTLFEKSLELNPSNDSSKVGLGACYLFGNISSNPMEGIMAIRQVVEKDPNNMYGQMMLGLGGVRSGQFDKAIERFSIVVKNQPNNLEAVFNLAEAYDRKGDKQNAITWYKVADKMVAIPEAKKEIEQRIKTLQ